MIVKIHEAYRNVVAICDSEILGKKFEEGRLQLDLSGSFFMGEEKTEEEVREIIEDQKREDATFNIAGEKACRLALEAGLIDQSGISRVDGVPVALALL
jgi:hypothetical protein